MYNLFSLTKMLLQGWELGKNREKNWLSKGKKKLKFDIKLHTKRGVFFCIYFKQLVYSFEVSASA